MAMIIWLKKFIKQVEKLVENNLKVVLKPTKDPVFVHNLFSYLMHLEDYHDLLCLKSCSYYYIIYIRWSNKLNYVMYMYTYIQFEIRIDIRAYNFIDRYFVGFIWTPKQMTIDRHDCLEAAKNNMSEMFMNWIFYLDPFKW